MTVATVSLETMRRSLRGVAGIARSLRIYYGTRGHRDRMMAIYGGLIAPGDLIFDIGAHVGDRTGVFHAMGARVVAVEPQPAAYGWLKLRYGRTAGVTLVRAALSDAPGPVMLHLNLANPTVSTASPGFIAAAEGADGWEGQHWDQTIAVPGMTLDALIESYGMPAFVKIDVEGFELHVLNGLTCPLPALSFEFTTIQRDVAVACLNRIGSLGSYRFNVALGESHRLEFGETVGAGEMADFIRALPHGANSGDVYATLERDRENRTPAPPEKSCENKSRQRVSDPT